MQQGRFSILICCLALLISCQSEKPTADHIQVPEGFVVEHIHFPGDPRLDQGSWVSICKDDKGRLIASDQYGYLYRITPPPIPAEGEASTSTEAEVEKIPIQLGHAQGLLWAFNSLYVTVNASEGVDGQGSGFYRVQDTDGDDVLDNVERLKDFEGSGEHGPHAILKSPTEEYLFVLGGNHTDPPADFESVLSSDWQEDNLFPVIKDPRGHANDRTAPGGWIAVTDPEGKHWEIVSSGYRNSYDMAFTAEQEILVFDSDMEWDMGMPWYRPIRVVHATLGSEYGWRTGSGKWPQYYPDNLPPVINIGQGSPTGVLIGKDLAFPDRFKQGLFIMDWSFGTMYFISLFPEGSTYRGEKEEFLSGVPLPLTDMVAGDDGAMYFTTGGRRVESHMYRVYYNGPADPAPVSKASNTADNQLFKLRRQIEHTLWEITRKDKAPHQLQELQQEAYQLFWHNLDHEDRFIRYTARVGLERIPVNMWKSDYLKINSANHIIEGSIALARMGEQASKSTLLARLNSLNYKELNEQQQLSLLRAYSLIFIRLGAPEDRIKELVISQLNPFYPAETKALNLELAKVLSYLEAPGVVGKTLKLIEESGQQTGETPYLSQEIIARSEQYGPTIKEMLAHMPSRAEISFVNSLSHVKEGWSMDQRREYFKWFADAMQRKGGMSYKGFIDKIREQAMGQLSTEDLKALSDVNEQFIAYKAVNLADLPKAKGPGKNYSMSELRKIVREAEGEQRNFEEGKKLYAAALCSSCHMMQGEGGNVGPNLTQAHTRFETRDMLWAIVAPSDVISDQYAATQFNMKDGKTVSGRFVEEKDGKIYVNTNPYDPTQSIAIVASEVETRENFPVSTMPPGLLNKLNPTEIADLMAYLMAGGDEGAEVYQ